MKYTISEIPNFAETFFEIYNKVVKNYIEYQMFDTVDIIDSINFISAIDKTKKTFINKLSDLLDINLNIKDLHKYDKRKEFAINITDNVINSIQKQLFNIISTNKYILSKKKDDFADTLLYVLYILLL
jgi:hypothetical protein